MRTPLCIGDVLVTDDGISYTVLLRDFADDGTVRAYKLKRHGADVWPVVFPWMLFEYRVICTASDTNHGWGRG